MFRCPGEVTAASRLAQLKEEPQIARPRHAYHDACRDVQAATDPWAVSQNRLPLWPDEEPSAVLTVADGFQDAYAARTTR